MTVEEKGTANGEVTGVGGGGEAHPGATVGGSCPFGSSKEKEKESTESLKKTE